MRHSVREVLHEFVPVMIDGSPGIAVGGVDETPTTQCPSEPPGGLADCRRRREHGTPSVCHFYCIYCAVALGAGQLYFCAYDCSAGWPTIVRMEIYISKRH